MTERMSRRQALAAGAECVAVSAVSGCSLFARLFPPGQRPRPTPVSARAIDVHCHIFNGTDLPITGFLEDIVLSLPDNALSIAPDALVALVSAVVKGQGISARDEAVLLRSGAHVRALARPLSDDELFRSRVTPAIAGLRDPGAPTAQSRFGLCCWSHCNPKLGQSSRTHSSISAASAALRD